MLFSKFSNLLMYCGPWLYMIWELFLVFVLIICYGYFFDYQTVWSDCLFCCSLWPLCLIAMLFCVGSICFHRCCGYFAWLASTLMLTFVVHLVVFCTFPPQSSSYNLMVSGAFNFYLCLNCCLYNCCLLSKSWLFACCFWWWGL